MKVLLIGKYDTGSMTRISMTPKGVQFQNGEYSSWKHNWHCVIFCCTFFTQELNLFHVV